MSLARRSRAQLLRSFALDRGFATAEFAMVLPAVLLVGAMIVWVLSLSITQLQIQSAAYSIARSTASGQTDVAEMPNKFPANFRIKKIISSNYVTVEIDVRKPLMNQHVPLGVDLSAVAISKLERTSATQSN